MAGPCRVLYLDTSPTVGGSVLSLYDLCRGLNRDRYDPIVVSYAPHAYVERFRELGVEVIPWNVYGAGDHRPAWVKRQQESGWLSRLRQIPLGARLYHGAGFALLLARRVWPRARALQALITARRVSLVHTNIRVGHDREGVLAAKLARIPCVCHVRDYESLGPVDRKLASWAAAFIYISQAVRASHVRAGAPASKGHVVYNGIDVDAFEVGASREEGRRSLGLTDGDLAVGLVGRLERWKGHEPFLGAMALVHQQLPGAKGLIIGNSVPYDPDYAKELSDLCQSLGLADSVHFSGFRPDVARVMSALDVVVLASTSPEPFGRVVVEAMAAARPVVAADAGASREILDSGVQGLLVPPGDEGALADALVQILSDPYSAVAMGQRGREKARARFGVEGYVSGVQRVYEELLH